jgi:hypothetical protein
MGSLNTLRSKTVLKKSHNKLHGTQEQYIVRVILREWKGWGDGITKILCIYKILSCFQIQHNTLLLLIKAFECICFFLSITVFNMIFE